MRRLWPDPGEVDDVAALVAAEARPARGDRPWVLVNMITSLDGAIAISGRSGALGGLADKAMFTALRAIADVILVGAGTARAERYGPARPSDVVRSERRARGQSPAPPIAVVSRSLDLDLRAPLFTEGDERTIVITCASSDAARRTAVSDAAELVVAGHDAVDLPLALSALAHRGAAVVTCEGGPSLNGDLIAADLVDEWDLTLSPLLVSGAEGRSSRGPAPLVPSALRLARMLEDDQFLLGRWVRDDERTRAAPNTSA